MEHTWVKFFRPVYAYSEAFKKKVVREFEKGGITKDGLKRKYGLGGKSQVLMWCKKYGKLSYNSPRTKEPLMKDKDAQKQRIRALEKELKDAKEKLLVYGKLIEVTNRELDADVLKKIEAELSRSLHQKGK